MGQQGETEYLFVDGGYLKVRYRETMAKVFETPGSLDIGRVKHGMARKVFFYDCIDDSIRDEESDADYNARVQRQIDELNACRSVEGFHVRLGSITGSNRKIRQKQVDILLAV